MKVYFATMTYFEKGELKTCNIRVKGEDNIFKAIKEVELETQETTELISINVTEDRGD